MNEVNYSTISANEIRKISNIADLWAIFEKNSKSETAAAALITQTCVLKIKELKFLESETTVADIFAEKSKFSSFAQFYSDHQATLANVAGGGFDDIMNVFYSINMGKQRKSARNYKSRKINEFREIIRKNDKSAFLSELESIARAAVNNCKIFNQFENIENLENAQTIDTLTLLINAEDEAAAEQIENEKELERFEKIIDAKLFEVENDEEEFVKSGNLFPKHSKKILNVTKSLFGEE